MVTARYSLSRKLLDLYSTLGEFDKGEALIKKVDFSYWWEWPMCRAYQKFCILKGLDKMNNEQYAQAIQEFERIFELPANLGYVRSTNYDDQRANYLIGWCYEKLGKLDEAKETWRKTIAAVYEARWGPGTHRRAWQSRYYQALCLQKLGRWGEATVYLDGLKEYTLGNKRSRRPSQSLVRRIAAIRLARRTEDIFKDVSQVERTIQK